MEHLWRGLRILKQLAKGVLFKSETPAMDFFLKESYDFFHFVEKSIFSQLYVIIVLQGNCCE